MRTVHRLLAAGSLALAPMAFAPAAAATIIGGGTQVTLTAADTLTGLGLSFTPFGTASLLPSDDDPIVSFLITGGSRDDTTGELLIEHDGSGLEFTAGGKSLRIGDFLIDTAAGLVSGSAIANGSALGVVPLFELGSGLTLLLTDEAAGAFTTVFGAPNLSGATIGTAVTVPVFAAAIPEPAAWTLMIGGFALAGTAIRRRAPARVHA